MNGMTTILIAVVTGVAVLLAGNLPWAGRMSLGVQTNCA